VKSKRAIGARVVVPVDKDGNYVETPLHWTVHSSLRDSLEQYLEHRSKGTLLEDQVFATLQRRVDALLRAVLEGKEPRTVFRLEPKKKRGERKDVGREQAMFLEVQRLVLLHKFKEPSAKTEVASAFNVDIHTVQRAVKRWRGKMPRWGNTSADVENYERNLRIRKLLT
jgi:hypothetical protein